MWLGYGCGCGLDLAVDVTVDVAVAFVVVVVVFFLFHQCSVYFSGSRASYQGHEGDGPTKTASK